MSTYNSFQSLQILDYAGLYFFIDTTTSQVYVGQTIRSLEKRLKEHLLLGVADNNRKFF